MGVGCGVGREAAARQLLSSSLRHASRFCSIYWVCSSASAAPSSPTSALAGSAAAAEAPRFRPFSSTGGGGGGSALGTSAVRGGRG